jgi:excisionase family DNA binding protein
MSEHQDAVPDRAVGHEPTRCWSAQRRRPREVDRPIEDLGTHSAREVTVRVLAHHLECDPRTIVRMIAERTLAAYKVGREWRVVTESARQAFRSTCNRT